MVASATSMARMTCLGQISPRAWRTAMSGLASAKSPVPERCSYIGLSAESPSMLPAMRWPRASREAWGLLPGIRPGDPSAPHGILGCAGGGQSASAWGFSLRRSAGLRESITAGQRLLLLLRQTWHATWLRRPCLQVDRLRCPRVAPRISPHRGTGSVMWRPRGNASETSAAAEAAAEAPRTHLSSNRDAGIAAFAFEVGAKSVAR